MADLNLKNYAAPGPYTSTSYDSPVQATLAALSIPLFIGEGTELLTQNNLEVVRGSSSTLDEKSSGEDLAGRAVVSISKAGFVTLGDFDGTLTKFKVRNLPIVNGNGTGTPTNSRGDVTVTFDGESIVVRSVVGVTGIIELAQAPEADQIVRCTYQFSRQDLLATDDVSAQVTAGPAIVQALSGIGDINAASPDSPTPKTLDMQDAVAGGQAANNILNVIVDGLGRSITIPAKVGYTMAQIASAISSAKAGTLVATTFTDAFGQSALKLSSDGDLVILDGSANQALGLANGQASIRTKTFYTFNGPIVDGSNGGITSTNPSHVVVKIAGVVVAAVKLDGNTRAVTLAAAPKAGSKVTIQYHHNTWQDTYDLLGDSGVSEVLRIGDVPGQSTYVQGQGFVLANDKILWGAASVVAAGITTSGSTAFGPSQVSTALVDSRAYMLECTPVLDVTNGVPVASRKMFLSPELPTLGNGRDTKLGKSLFQDLANSRIDLPAHRPDVVVVYWGWDLQDALARGPVAVTKIDGSVISLASIVPVGAKVWASHYYNHLGDAAWSLKATLAGSAGIGTYEILDAAGANVVGASFDPLSKSASLAGIPIGWPSGVEANADLRHEAVANSLFLGPIEETATVQFKARTASPARFSVPGSGPYTLVHDHSDHMYLKVNQADLAQGAAGIDLGLPLATKPGVPAIMVGDEVNYSGGVGSVVGASYTLTADEELNVTVDGVDIKALVPMGAAGTARTIGHYVTHLNEAANGHHGTTSAAGAGSGLTISLNDAAAPANSAMRGTNYYKGWIIATGTGTGALADAVRVIDSSLYTGGHVVATIVAATLSPVTGIAQGTFGAPTATENNKEYTIFNPATMAQYVGATRFDAPVTSGAGLFDVLNFIYQGDSSGSTGALATASMASTYATAGALATAVQSAMNASIAAAITGGAVNFKGLRILVSANSNNQLVFKVIRGGKDSAGVLSFIADAAPAQDFAILAGLDAGPVAIGAGQAMLVQAPIAKVVNVTDVANATILPYDRIMIRNRLIPGGLGNMTADSAIAQAKITIQAGTGNIKAGLTTGTMVSAASRATVSPATLVGRSGMSSGQDNGTKQPLVLFYDGTGVHAKNNVLKFTLDGVAVTATFAATADGSGAGSLLLGPLVSGNGTSVLDVIAVAMSTAGLTTFGTKANIVTSGYIKQEGTGFRLTSSKSDVNSHIVIGDGSANATFGLVESQSANRSLVAAATIASALNSDGQVANEMAWALNFAANGGNGTSFAETAIASVVKDAAGGEHLYLQTLKAGAAYSIQWKNATIEDTLFHGTGLDVVADTASAGDAALGGFVVTSNVVNGSGSSNDSILSANAGQGQDGFIGQTYHDKVTGLTFTVLPRGFLDNNSGPWPAYPANGSFTLVVSKTFKADSNLVKTALPGIELLVTNTSGTTIGDTALVTTYDRSGTEPNVGDVYYVSYTHTKANFKTKFFSKVSAIEKEFGPVSPDNPLSLAAYLAFLNGAVVVACKQVVKEAGSTQASLATYKAAIAEIEGVLPGQVKPDIIVPLRGDSDELFQILAKSNDKMSSIRYKSERTSIIGMAAGRTPAEVKNLAELLGNRRMRVVYPDMAIVPLTDPLGNSRDYLVDGFHVAAALAGSIVNPSVDVATPWTNRKLVGFRQLGRSLDEVVMNQIASSGVTVFVDKPPFIVVRHGLTTDMTDVNTKTPTIVQSADEVQRQCRQVMDSFIGIKFLPGVLTQIEGRLSMLLKSLVAQQILTGYAGVKATLSPDDPTRCDVAAFVSFVYPLLYIPVNFTVRSQV